MRDEKNCKTCHHHWDKSDGTTKYCKLRILGGGGDPKCAPYEIENGCEYWIGKYSD